MSAHKGFSVTESLIVLLLTAPLMFAITNQMQLISYTVSAGHATIHAYQALSIFWPDISNDIKSAEFIEVSEDTLSLVSTSNFIAYTFDPEKNTLTRSDSRGSEEILSEVDGSFIPIDQDAVGIYLSIDGKSINVTINR